MITDMYHLALVIEYNGSQFYGYQKQKNGKRTVQGELEQALSKFAGEPIHTITAGRTDAGVHALYQVVSFSTTISRLCHNWRNAVNSFLPDDIVVREVVETNPEFNARFSAVARTYEYYLYISPSRPALLRGRVGWYYRELDCGLIKKLLTYLLGERDFASFRASDCQAKNRVKKMSVCSLEQKANMLKFTFTANAFLYHMIRNIIGMAVYLGSGKITLDDCIDIVEACNRKLAPPTFMPDGLYLAQVYYKDNYFSYKPTPVIF